MFFDVSYLSDAKINFSVSNGFMYFIYFSLVFLVFCTEKKG